MATNFPASLDNGTSLPYPTSGNFTNSPSLAGGQDNQNDAIIAAETKLGTGASTPTTNTFLTGTGTGTSAWGNTVPTGTVVGTSDTQTLTNKTLTSPTINNPTISNATITADTVAGFTTSNSGTIYGVPVTTGSISGSVLSAGTVGTTALATNAVQASQIATSAITLGYAQVTSNLTTANTSAVQATGLTLTVTIPAGGRRVRVSAWTGGLSNNTGADGSQMSLWQGTVGSGTQLANSNIFPSASIDINVNAYCVAILSPSAGSVTYNVGFNSVTGGTTTIVAAANNPAFILVEAI